MNPGSKDPLYFLQRNNFIIKAVLINTLKILNFYVYIGVCNVNEVPCNGEPTALPPNPAVPL